MVILYYIVTFFLLCGIVTVLYLLYIIHSYAVLAVQADDRSSESVQRCIEMIKLNYGDNAQEQVEAMHYVLDKLSKTCRMINENIDSRNEDFKMAQKAINVLLFIMKRNKYSFSAFGIDWVKCKRDITD